MSSLNKPLHVSGLNLQNPLMNGAYIGSKTLEDAKKLAGSSCGAVVIGSISIKPRKRNPGPGYWLHKDGFFALNSFGMPNGGLPYFKKALPEIVRIVHAHNKPIIANIVGFTSEEFVALIKFAHAAGVDMVELNLGCPNVWNDGEQEHILSYHPQMVRSTLDYIAKTKPRVKVCVKISPLPPDLLREVADVLIDSNIVAAVTATNSYPNAAITSGARSNNEPQDVLVGMTGRALKPISLGVVKQLRQLLPSAIDIIGCGGISSANDVLDYLNAGAKAVQLATSLKERGLAVFDSILSHS